MVNNPVIAIWVSAYSEVGLGHLVRCVAFAQAWKRYGRAIFFGHLQTHFSRELVRSDLSNKIVDIAEGANIVKCLDLIEQYCAPGSWIVCDDYTLISSDLLEVRKAGFKIVLLDDFVDRQKWFFVDAVVTSAELELAEIVPPSEAHLPLIFSGAKYRFVRQEFSRLRYSAVKNKISRTFNVLICFGGTDSFGFTETVLGLLSGHLSTTERIQVIIGPMNSRSKHIKKLAGRIPQTVTISQSPLSVESLLMDADLSVVSASGIAWESLAMSVPTLAIATTENQRMSLLSLQNIDGAETLESIGSPNEKAINNSLASVLDCRRAIGGGSNFDGAGASRVAEVLAGMYRKGFSENQVLVRRMRIQDSHQVYLIANDVGVRRQAFNSEFISYDEHLRWFKEKLSDEKTLSYVIESGGLILGFIHYSQIDSGADIDIAIHPSARRRGLGKLILLGSLDDAMVKMNSPVVIAWVLEGNNSSISMFEKCGFLRSGVSVVRGKKAVRLSFLARSAEI